MTEAHELEPVPEHLRAHRDELRVKGTELVKLTPAAARERAIRVRHSAADYAFAYHRISGIYGTRVHIEPLATSHVSES